MTLHVSKEFDGDVDVFVHDSSSLSKLVAVLPVTTCRPTVVSLVGAGEDADLDCQQRHRRHRDLHRKTHTLRSLLRP